MVALFELKKFRDPLIDLRNVLGAMLPVTAVTSQRH